MLTQLAELSVIWSDASIHGCFTGEGAIRRICEDAALARSNAYWRRCFAVDHEGVMADIRGITLSNSAALRLQVRDNRRALSALARLMRWPRIRPPATGRPRSPWGITAGSVSRSARAQEHTTKCGRVRH